MFEKTVLIVDDDDMILMMLNKILSNEFNVVTALSGEEAIEKFGQINPDIIISDYMMPKMNGFEMMDKLRDGFGEKVFAIFLTANDQEETEFAVFRHGAIDFIRKPIKAEDILEAVRRGIAKVDEIKNGAK